MSEESCYISVARKEYFSLFQSVQSSTVAHWTSLSMDTGVLSPAVKWFGLEADYIPHISDRQDEWSSTFTPHIPSGRTWRQLYPLLDAVAVLRKFLVNFSSTFSVNFSSYCVGCGILQL